MDSIDERAEALKKEGNLLYASQNYAAAVRVYSDVRSTVEA